MNIENAQHQGIDLIDNSGRVLSSFRKGKSQIDISSYPSGTYHLRIKLEEGIQITNVIKI